jgi:DNA-binding HxlR family transcriptional regulator
MGRVKEYGQYCALARSLDQVGDRWSLLLVRELLLGPASYGQLLGRLPGLATNLLADRLRDLEAAGIVEPHERGAPYALTERGQALRPVVHELIRWGAPLMVSGPGEDVVQGHWVALALEAVLVSSSVTGPRTRLRVVCADTAVDVVLSRSGRSVEPASSVGADVELSGELPALLASAYLGAVAPGVEVVGDAAVAERVLRRV